MEEKNFEGVEYLVSYPEGFSEEKKYPLIIFLHGAGTRGESTELLKKNSCYRKLSDRQNARGYVLLAPLCRYGTWNEWMTVLVHLVEAYRALPFIDETRIHLTGNSMGGYATWELATLHADWFASAMPVCGGGIPAFAKRLAKLPIRTFHGLCDKTVDPMESMAMAKAVNCAGGYAELILFPQLPHNCWDEVYTNENNYDWLLSFTTERTETEKETLSGAKFG